MHGHGANHGYGQCCTNPFHQCQHEYGLWGMAFTPNTTQTYTVTGTAANGCAGTAQTTVTVNAAPTLSISASANTVCAGTAVTLTGSGANSYSWNNGVSNGTAFTPNTTQTYTVTGTAANGCTGTAQTTVTVNAVPIANAGQDRTGVSTCGRDTTTLAAAPLQAGQQGTWTIIGGQNGIVSLNTPNSMFQGMYGATYTLQWNVTQNGCTGSDQMVVTFNQPNVAALGAQIGSQDLLWSGLTHTDWSTASNWYQKQAAGHYVRMSGNAQPGIASEVFMLSQANGGMCIGTNAPILSMSSNAEDVYVGSGCTLNLSGNVLNIAQNLVNNGTIIASTGTTNFTGSSNGIISGTGNTQLYDMTVNKSQGASLTLQQPVLVTNTLTMTQGNIFTTNANLLTLGTSSA
ncbi:MAG: hypothetical protein EB023_14425, partial [Flavobacteriia bacterium]|nr:hypothetical protein [Flavobacteriia bacterium]